MIRSTRSTMLAVVLTASVAVACSSSSGDDAGDAATTVAAKTDAATYIDGLCSSLGDWKAGVDTDNGQLQAALGGSPSPEDGKAALVEFLTTTVDSTKGMVSDIEALGVPDIDGGADVASTISSELGKVVTLFQGVLDDAENLSTDDPQAMLTALGGLTSTLNEGSTEIGAALGNLDAPELEDAAKDSPACQALTTG